MFRIMGANMRTLPMVTAFVFVAGCGSSSNSSQTTSLETCVPGWWQEAVTSPCSCLGQPQPPECAQSDCVERGFTGYLSGGMRVDGRYAYSAKGGTFSSTAPAVTSSYSIATNGI